MAKVKKQWPSHEWAERDTGRYGPKPNPSLPVKKAKKLQKSFNEGYG